MRSVFFIFCIFINNQILFAQDEFFEPTTTIGGYGELHYNYNKEDDERASKNLDFHRFVLFLSHTWTEKWSFKSEIELEHNFVSEGEGELELEQAFINYHHNDMLGVQAGVVLPSIGLLNEHHEPPLFLSVERPDYSKSIIPTTWFGNGIAIYGRYTSFSYKAVLMEGLNGAKFTATDGIRGGRQKGYKSDAQEFLYNLRLDYTGFKGLKIGASATYNDAIAGVDSTIGTIIFDFHALFIAHNIYSVFEFGEISFDGFNSGFLVQRARGYYFDFGYDLAGIIGFDGQIIPWLRFTDYNTSSKVKGGGNIERANHFKKWLIGISIKPIPEVVLKIDYGVKTRQLNDVETKQFNLGVGYNF